MNLINDNLKEIIIGLSSLITGFLGGMKYSSNKNKKINIKQKSGSNSTNNAAGGNIHLK